jgi:N,N'-diacetyllegionaminate synthase
MILVNNFKIQSKIIGKNRVFVIAEIGINHLGNLTLCKKMIDAAHASGADAVKLQIINADESYSKSSLSYNYFKKYSLSNKDIIKVSEHCNKKNIILFATPGDFSSLEIIKKLDFPAIKISSGLLTNLPLIKEASKTKKPVILSTGMALDKDLEVAIQTVIKEKNRKISFLDCASLYPCPLKDVNFNRFKKFKLKYIYGYSDHTLGSLSSIVAVSRGAKIIEKHFTIDRKLKKGDNSLSIEPHEFRELISNIRSIELFIDNKLQKPTLKEISNRCFAHRYLAAKKNIKKGDKFNLENVCFMRFGKIKSKLLSPKIFNEIINKRSKYLFKKGQPIRI